MRGGDVLDRASLLRTHEDALASITVDASPQEKLAFWRTSKKDVAVATQRLQATCDWRTRFGIDRIMSDPSWLEQEREFRHVLLYDYFGPDRHGRPVLVERVGACSPERVLASGADPERLLTLHCMACEVQLRMARSPSALDDRGQIIVLDFRGLTLRHLDPRIGAAFGKLATNHLENYPDTLAHIYVVNAPSIFSAVVKLARPFMPTDSFTRVHVSRGVPQELVSQVGVECLPAELGGERQRTYPYHESAPVSAHPRSPNAAGGTRSEVVSL